MTKHTDNTTHTNWGRLASLMLLGLVVLATTQPVTAITIGTTETKTLMVEADPQTDEGTLGLGLATANCKGVPIIAMACTGTITAHISMCVEVQATAGGFVPVRGEACFQWAGAAAVAATGSLTNYLHEAHAGYNAFMAPYKEQTGEQCYEKWMVDPHVMGGDGGKYVTVCEPTYGTYQDIEVAKADCSEAHNQITEAVEAFLQDPLDITGWMPGWEAHDCPASRGTDAAFLCIELWANAEAEADLWESDDKVPGNECKAKGVVRYTEPPEDEYQLSAQDRSRLIDAGVAKYRETLAQLLTPTIDDIVAGMDNETHVDLTRALLSAAFEDLISHAGEDMRQTLETQMYVQVFWEDN